MPATSLQFALPRAAVMSLRVARLAHADIGLDVDLEEAASSERRTRALPVVAIGGNESGDAHEPGFGEKRRDFAGAPDVLLAILGRSAEIGVETAQHAVFIERERRISGVEKLPLERHGQSRFHSRGRRLRKA
jgi:hypothetical protein